MVDLAPEFLFTPYEGQTPKPTRPPEFLIVPEGELIPVFQAASSKYGVGMTVVARAGEPLPKIGEVPAEHAYVKLTPGKDTNMFNFRGEIHMLRESLRVNQNF